MSKIDYILDNELFIIQLEKRLLEKHKSSPNDVNTLVQLGDVYRKTGDLVRAKQYFEKILNINSEHEWAKWTNTILAQKKVEDHSSERILPTPFLLIQDFLPDDKLAEINKIIEENSNFFNESMVNYQKDVVDNQTRKSKVLNRSHFSLFAQLFIEKLKGIIPRVSEQLNVQVDLNKRNELALTMHLDGDFFKIHSDVIANEKGSSRKLTYVFYYHREPKGFKGGDLLLLDSSKDGKSYDLNYTKIAPVRNSIVFFPSQYYHKVTPIKLTTDDYLQGRYTINGWFHG